MFAKINMKRLAKVQTISHGGHSGSQKPKAGAQPAMCVMEAVAWVTGEEWSDHPNCVDGMLNSVAIEINDKGTEDVRQALIPLIPRLINTRDDGLEVQRYEWVRKHDEYVMGTMASVKWFAELLEVGREPATAEEVATGAAVVEAMANPETTVKELLGIANTLDKVPVYAG